VESGPPIRLRRAGRAETPTSAGERSGDPPGEKFERRLRCPAIAFSGNQRMTVISTPTSSPRQVESAVMAPTPALKATAKQARSPKDSTL